MTKGKHDPLMQALSRLAGNRQSDGVSSTISAADRAAIITGCHDLLSDIERQCTCHPDDNPPSPCAGKYALTECREDAAKRVVRHKKRGTIYEVIATGRLQVDGDLDMEKVTVYRGQDGQVWVRPDYEFNDGRFEIVVGVDCGGLGQ